MKRPARFERGGKLVCIGGTLRPRDTRDCFCQRADLLGLVRALDRARQQVDLLFPGGVYCKINKSALNLCPLVPHLVRQAMGIFLERLVQAHSNGQLQFFGEHAPLAQADAFARWIAPMRRGEWVVYAKRPFAGPAAVLAYLSRYTHRVAISNKRLVAMDQHTVTFRWKDYRAKGRTRHKTMTLDADEFMRRFLLHVLPRGFHRIRAYGLMANAERKGKLATARALLTQPAPTPPVAPDPSPTAAAPPSASPRPATFLCPQCSELKPLTISCTACRRNTYAACFVAVVDSCGPVVCDNGCVQ